MSPDICKMAEGRYPQQHHHRDLYQRDREGLPIGIQIVGKRWSESCLLAMAKALTEVTGAFQRPLGY